MKMKNLIVLMVALTAAGSFNSTYAQNADAKKTYTKVVDASADNVWSVLRKMDQIDKYTNNVARVEWSGNMGVGGSRKCFAPDGQGYFKENIVAYDDTNRTFTYAVVEGVPVKGMVNSWKVVDLGYMKSMVVWTTNYDEFMENPQMTFDQFMGFIDASLNEFVGNVVAEAKM